MMNNPMKILQISYSVSSATSCMRLKSALEKKGHKVKVLTTGASKSLEDTQGLIIIRRSFIDKVYRKICYLNWNLVMNKVYPDKKNGLYSSGFEGIPYRKIKKYVKEADVVHIHWALMMIDYQNTMKIVRDCKKVVWTAHDCWPFTGGCHYVPKGCDGYITGCKKCPLLNSKSKYDITRWIYTLKLKNYSHKITMIGPSNWMSDHIRTSAIFNSNEVFTVPNALDSSIYKVLPKEALRHKYGLPLDRRIILTGAADITSPYKGYGNFVSLLEAISNDHDLDDVYLVLFGKNNDISDICHDIPYKQLGYIDSPQNMAEVYSLADVFVLTSTDENLPTVVMEAMSCGTPVTTFDVGGVADMISHQKDGYIAEAFDVKDFVKGIKWCFNFNNELRNEMHNKIAAYCDDEVVSQRHIEIYER